MRTSVTPAIVRLTISRVMAQAPGGQDHKDSMDCRTCHAHIDGFSADPALSTVSAPHTTVADCTFCHVGTDYEAAIPDTKCDSCHTPGGANKPSYPTAQDVVTHAGSNVWSLQHNLCRVS